MKFHKSLVFGLVMTFGLAACQSSEDRAEEHFQSGMELREDGDLARAAIEFRNVFRFDGAHKAARTSLAEIFIEQGNPNAAFSQYLRLAEQYPDDVDVRLALAKLALDMRSWTEFRRHGQAAVEDAPDRPESHAVAAMLEYLDAAEAEDAEAKAEALASAEKLLESDAELSVARELTIIAYLDASAFEDGLRAINTALSRSPDDLRLNTTKLQVLNALDRPDDVEATLLQMYDRFPENEEVNRDLIAWYMQRDDLDAVEALLRERAGAADSENTEDHLTLVQFLVQTDQIDSARAELDQLVEANADTPERANRYAIAAAGLAFDAGDRDAAIQSLRSTIESGAAGEEINNAKNTLAQMLLATGNPVGARSLVEEVLADDGSNVAALKMRANWLIEADQPAEAISALREALDQAPNDPSIFTLMATAHLRAGSTQLAGERLSLAVEMSNNGVDETLRYARFLREQNRISAARSVLSDAIEANPLSIALLTEQARLASEQGDTATARAAIDTLEGIEDSPEASERATTLRAALLLSQSRMEEGIALLEERAEGADASNGAVLDVVRTRLIAGRADDAISYLDERLTERPDDPELRFAKALLLDVIDRTEQSEAAFGSLVQDFPQSDASALQLYRLQIANGRPEDAKKTLDAALERMPESRSLLLVYANNLEHAGKLDEALAIYQSLYERNSGDILVANNLASLLSEQEDNPESLSRAATVAQRLKDSEVPAFQDTYGWIKYRQGDHEQALVYLEPAASALPESAVIQYHLGMAYLAADRTEEARTALEKSVELGGDSRLPQIVKARDVLQTL